MPSSAPRPHSSVVLLVSCAPLLANADAGLVVLALPGIRRDLSMSLIEAHWVTNLYVVLVGGLQLLGGRLCDRYGARRLLRGSLAGFGAASLVCALAPSATVLLMGRAGQAVAAAAMVPAAMCVLFTVVPGEAERRRALARWTASGGIGAVAGVLAGGLAAGHLGWRWAFLLDVPLALGAAVAARRLGPDVREHHPDTALDVRGALLPAGALLSLVYALVGLAEHGFGFPTWTALAVAVLLGGAFSRWRRRTRASGPLLPAVVLRNRPLAVSALGIVFVAASTGPVVFVGSLYLQEARGYGAWPAACALLPVVGGVLVVGRWCVRALGRFGPRRSCLAGCGLTGSGLVLLTRLSPDSRYATEVLPGLLLIGAGLPVLWMACELASVSTLDPSAIGAAAGVVQCAGQIGAALGLGLAVTLYTGTGAPTDPAAGAGRVFWCCTALTACVALTAYLGLRPDRRTGGVAGHAPSSMGWAPDRVVDGVRG
ncbi:MFS transporter [Streptomyces sp. ADMS]|uniref:MFS transporter n=1 Tax=Streptomyces sp. ADMS TaxID=3071415 RepID=UPI00296E4E2F|nr:MFS transporter [Streptomyces sp. ADMS]MDW4910077.1 MFS transporter [Streptomyces sp. ADMS]